MPDETLPEKKPWWQSVAHPGMGATVKGVLIGVVPMVVLIAQQFNVDLTPSDLTEVVDSLWSLVAIGVTTYGLVRKLMYKFKKPQ